MKGFFTLFEKTAANHFLLPRSASNRFARNQNMFSFKHEKHLAGAVRILFTLVLSFVFFHCEGQLQGRIGSQIIKTQS